MFRVPRAKQLLLNDRAAPPASLSKVRGSRFAAALRQDPRATRGERRERAVKGKLCGDCCPSGRSLRDGRDAVPAGAQRALHRRARAPRPRNVRPRSASEQTQTKTHHLTSLRAIARTPRSPATTTVCLLASSASGLRSHCVIGCVVREGQLQFPLLVLHQCCLHQVLGYL